VGETPKKLSVQTLQALASGGLLVEHTGHGFRA